MRLHFLAILAVAVVSVIGYSGTLDYPFHFDDYPNIVSNRAIHAKALDFETLKRVVFGGTMKTRPLSNLSFAMNHALCGTETRGFRIVNIAIHGLTAGLVYLLIYQLCAFTSLAGKPGSRILFSCFTAAVWGAHPAQIQSVVYIVQRMTSLSVMFSLGAFNLYVFRRLRGGSGRLLFVLAAALWIAGLLSKEIALILPLACLLFELIFFPVEIFSFFRTHKRKIIALTIVLTATFLLFSGEYFYGFVMKAYAKKDYGPMERVMTEFRVLAHYQSLMILPFPSRFNLQPDFVVSKGIFSPPATFACMVFMVVELAFLILLARKAPFFSFWGLWFFLCLSIESTFIGLELAFDHRLYMPSVGFIALALYPLFTVRPGGAKLKICSIAAIIVLLVVATHSRAEVWATESGLWADSLQKSPNSPRCLYNVALFTARSRNYSDAESLLKRVIAINPKAADAYNLLGSCLLERNDLPGALNSIEKALTLDEWDFNIRLNLGNCLLKMGHTDKAVEGFIAATCLNPYSPEAFNNLAVALANTGKYDRALQMARRAVELAPHYADARANFESIAKLASGRRKGRIRLDYTTDRRTIEK